MSIDLDGLSTKRGNSGSNINEERGHGDEMWDFLLYILEQSKPSERFSVENHSMRHTSSLSSNGKNLTARLACEICATLSSLSGFIQNKDAKLTTAFQSLSQTYLDGMNQATLRNDASYVQQIKQCLGAELSQLMKDTLPVNAIKDEKAIFSILATFIEALVDANTLNVFPTSNLDVMMTLGGNKSKEKEEKIATKLCRFVEIASENVENMNPDFEAKGFDKPKEDLLSFPGRYMSTHLWSFGKDLGESIIDPEITQSTHDESANIMLCLRKSLLNSNNDLDPLVQNVCSDVLETLPLVSLERECMKRFIALRGIFEAVVFRQISLNGEQENIRLYQVQTLVPMLLNQMLKELDIISSGVKYYEKNGTKEFQYQYAKARSLQQAYSIFLFAVASWLVNKISISNIPEFEELAQQLFNYLLIPSLKLSLRSSKGKHSTISSTSRDFMMNLDMIPNIIDFGKSNHQENETPSISLDLFDAANFHIRELVIFAANSKSVQRESTLFYEIVDSTLSTLVVQNKLTIRILPTLINGAEVNKTGNSSGLGESLELYLSIIPMNPNSECSTEERVVINFRKFVIRKFMLPKLQHTIPKKKIVILGYLAQILNNQSCFLNDDNSPVRNNSDNDNEECLELEEDICKILNSLVSSLENALKIGGAFRDSLLKNVFSCLYNLLSLKSNDGNTILNCCRLHTENNNYAAYFVSEMEYLQSLGDLLTGTSSIDFIRAFPSLTTEFDSLDENQLKVSLKHTLNIFRSLWLKREVFKNVIFPSMQQAGPNRLFKEKSIVNQTNDESASDTPLQTDTIDCIKKIKIA